jgi:hypothetical protein
VLSPVQEDPESERAGHLADVAIAQVHAQQIRVSSTLVLVEGFEPPLCPF